MEKVAVLRQLIAHVTDSLAVIASSRKNVFINEINPDMELYADPEVLTLVFSELLNTTIHHTENDCIRISAKKYSDIVLLNITETGCHSVSDIADRLEAIQAMAKQVGGCVTVSDYSIHGANVALSFFNGINRA